MDLGINGFLGRIKEHYDKVIAFGVLLALVASAVLLIIKFDDLNRVERAFESWLSELSPLNPDAALVEATPYEQALSTLESPLQLAVPSAEQEDAVWLFVPETRFNCRECRQPVAVGAEVCPFCDAPVVAPVEELPDHDNDGMLSE